MQIVIFGNCQVGGIADSLELLSNGLSATGVLVSNDPDVLFGQLSNYVGKQGNTILIQEPVRDIMLANKNLDQFDLPSNIYIPSISFAAFHPDIQYAFLNGAVVKSGLESDWNSRIVLWGYLQSLTQVEVECLFREETFQALGYFDEWEKSSEDLRKSFDACGLDFGRWMRSVQRTGVFMYGINHPMQIGLSQLAVQIAEKMFPDSSVVIEDLHNLTTDYLSHIVWPIYPEIGDCLGVEGFYHWRVARRQASLIEFIELCFSAWDKIELMNQELNFIPSISIEENQVLRDLAGL